MFTAVISTVLLAALCGGHVGQPLFLTPYLEKGDYMRAQKLSKVKPDIGNTTSYSGFLSVNAECDSHLFFWFFPAQNTDWKETPLVLWLQGGPGQSSLLGLFEEVGPLEYYEAGLKKRKYTWNARNNLLFIEQPVGVGYSFSREECYPETMTPVGEDLYRALVQLHVLFPTFTKNKLIIAGESFGGHYVPTIGHTIHKYNPTAKIKINLAAMMIGNGWTDPAKQIDYSSYLYQLGIIDVAEKNKVEKFQREFVEEVEEGEAFEATSTWYYLMRGLEQAMGDVDLYNYLPRYKRSNQGWDKFIQTPDMRRALKVGNLTYHPMMLIRVSLDLETTRSVKPWVEELLEFYPIIFYNGQVDIICAYPMTVNFLRSLSWSGQEKYLKATRSQWCVNEVSACCPGFREFELKCNKDIDYYYRLQISSY